jgi:uncharacterized protein (DUF2141 family)
MDTPASEDISALTAGTYAVVITDANGCSASGSFPVTVDQQTISITETIVKTNCTANNGSISIAITGGTPAYSVLWNNGATTSQINDLAAGTYSVTVTDMNGCSTSETFTIVVENATLSVQGTMNSAICTSKNGSISINVSGGRAGYKFNWKGPNGFSSNNQNIASLAPGNYTVDDRCKWMLKSVHSSCS